MSNPFTMKLILWGIAVILFVALGWSIAHAKPAFIGEHISFHDIHDSDTRCRYVERRPGVWIMRCRRR